MLELWEIEGKKKLDEHSNLAYLVNKTERLGAMDAIPSDAPRCQYEEVSKLNISVTLTPCFAVEIKV